MGANDTPFKIIFDRLPAPSLLPVRLFHNDWSQIFPAYAGVS